MALKSSISAEERWQIIEKSGVQVDKIKETLFDSITQTQYDNKIFNKNIENFIGTVKVPIGIAGPLRIKSSAGDKQYLIPLATTEAALVASTSRGCKVVNLAGGVSARVVDQRVQRVPVFMFENLESAINFKEWACKHEDHFKSLAESTTKHAKVIRFNAIADGTAVHLNFDMSTGDAAGQNMTTFAVGKVFEYIMQQNPEGLVQCAVDGGLSFDKNASVVAMFNTRGRRVVAEVTIPGDILEQNMRTTAEQCQRQWLLFQSTRTVGSMLGNAANIIAAVSIACGQDVACVAESSVGISRFDVANQRDLRICLTLPCLLLGTVGGGTGLPSQRACLELTKCSTANELAELIGGACIAAELSIVASFCANEFAKAHFDFARSRL